MDLHLVLDTAVPIAREAGELLRQGFGQEKEIATKATAVDWVTQFDQQAETLIVSRLRAAFPDHTLVGEEGGTTAGSSPYTWHIDPLDGTTNFAHGFPVFCVSLALVEGTRPLVGVIVDPLRDECFTAVAGQGAWLNGRRLHVSQADSLICSLLATGFPYDRHTSDLDNVAQLARFLKKVHGVRRAGAAALDMAYVAAGRLDGYWEFKLKSYDVAAGILLVQEAGGQVTDMNGRAIQIAPELAVVASNGRIHEDMLGVLRD
ncbi:MAG: inositol monophosphatase [Chloroflexi bacterium]|nr:inositol monophosphatase [Ardenticatenaceae bacterium]MBL1130717.1 inositol monophosphatase [Chloroflexota bacterium]NOG36810.1 inositol monophosphatase [Chloroflexota bacterium]GIK57865.1 MAG: inositol monophosphatase [Chloroflexota bacterium]